MASAAGAEALAGDAAGAGSTSGGSGPREMFPRGDGLAREPVPVSHGHNGLVCRVSMVSSVVTSASSWLLLFPDFFVWEQGAQNCIYDQLVMF